MTDITPFDVKSHALKRSRYLLPELSPALVCYTSAMPRLPCIAVDLGGTHLRAAFFAGTSPTPLHRTHHETPQTQDPAVVSNAIASAIREVVPPGLDLSSATIVVGTPGPVDPFRGIVLSAPNIPAWHNLALRDWLGAQFPATIQIVNDANLAALGELTFGAGRGVRELIYLTLGTGIGGAVITRGRLLLGMRGLAAELGHVTVDPNGPICSCGRRGHLEAIASGPAIARQARQRLAAGEPSSLAPLHSASPDLVTPEAIASAARDGDAFAIALLSETGSILGRFVADCLAVFAPERIILGGGLMALGGLLLDPLRRAAADHVMSSHYIEQVTITAAQLGDDAGLVGGLALSLNPDLQPVPMAA